jgi:hypothetical protein
MKDWELDELRACWMKWMEQLQEWINSVENRLDVLEKNVEETETCDSD